MYLQSLGKVIKKTEKFIGSKEIDVSDYFKYDKDNIGRTKETVYQFIKETKTSIYINTYAIKKEYNVNIDNLVVGAYYNIKYYENDEADFISIAKEVNSPWEGYFLLEIEEAQSKNLQAPTLTKMTDVKEEKIQFIQLKLNEGWIEVQRDGFTVIAGESGSGKTFNAVVNMSLLEDEYEMMIYVNLELTNNDILDRFRQYNLPIPKNAYLLNVLDLDEIFKNCEGKKSLIVIDNIDNLVDGNNEVYISQIKYVNKFRDWLLKTGNTGIVLSQITKGTSELFDHDNQWLYIVNQSSIAGAHQLVTLARSVVLNAKDYAGMFRSKIVKLGTGKANESTRTIQSVLQSNHRKKTTKRTKSQ